MNQHLLASSLLLALPCALLAQLPLVIPNGFTTTEGTSSTAWPWGRGTAQVRVMYIYDSSHFTNQGITGPVLVSGLRWRANGGAVNPGGTYNQVDVQLSTAAVDYTAPNATFAVNHGADLTTVYSGPVTVAAGAGTTPNNYYVDIPFAGVFLYDPTQGDFAVDLATDASGWIGAIGPALDSAGAAGLCSRVYNLTNWQSPTGTTQVGSSPILEVTLLGVAGAASVNSFGVGCPTVAPLSLQSALRPLLGTTITLQTSNLPAGTGLCAQMFGLQSQLPPLDLTGLGMPGCTQYLQIDATTVFLPMGGVGDFPLALPGNQVFVGLQIFSQSAALAPGVNALGVAASNALALTLGIL